ncbi:ABC transporter substrate-binding protein [Pelagibacterium lacus]|uniref:ABC transporter substrate-binding protein n=1 Tax=Pelagibacterium lacus TaxID=2282655 RepID=A0A369WD92_9HYPH|nr:ABC transporter substrate-binding protein [Pelagibacterium lacus]RDE10071.1 ABC transporter substrate-binding protein [Pelagibacterium lacus]
MISHRMLFLGLLAVGSMALTGTAAVAQDTLSPDNPYKIVLGTLPIGPMIPAFIGAEQGFFLDEGLEVEFKPEPAGQDIVTAIIAGEYHFGFSNQTSFLTARSRGLDIYAIASGTIGESDETSAAHGVLVPEDSPIQSMADLQGLRVSVDTFGNAPHVTVLRSLELAGVEDPLNDVGFIELGFPDVVPTVSAGRVDAGFAVEPFLTVGKNSGLRIIANPLLDTQKGFPLSVYITSGELIEERPDVVDAFIRAINNSMAYASENPDEVRDAFPRFNNNVSQELAESVDLSLWSTDFGPESLELGAELALKYGFIDSIPDLEEIVYQPGE